MNKRGHQLITLAAAAFVSLRAHAGTIFYVPIPATGSDANSGISPDNAYTSAVDAGNRRGSDSVVNGVTLYALPGSNDTSTANNLTLSVSTGVLTNGGGKTASILADGKLLEVLSDMTFNEGAENNSEQYIVLDPESLKPGHTYDLRV